MLLPVPPHTRRRAFTLVELLVVILILGILAVVGVVGYASVTAKARTTAAVTSLRQAALAVEVDVAADPDATQLSRAEVLASLNTSLATSFQNGFTAAAHRLGEYDDSPTGPGDFVVGFDDANGHASNEPGARATLMTATTDGRVFAQILGVGELVGGVYEVSPSGDLPATPADVLADSSPIPVIWLPPTSLSVAPTTTGATVTWAAAPGAVAYTVSSAPAGGPPRAWIVAGLSATVAALTAGTPYDVTVTAHFPAQGAASGTTPFATTPATPTSAPAAATATAGVGAVTLTWAAVTGDPGAAITDYEVTITPAPVIGATTRRTGLNGSPYVVTGLANTTAYSFAVRAVNAAGTGPAALAQATTPAAPTGKVTFIALKSAWTVPAGVTSVVVTANGGNAGASGGQVVARMPVTAGQVYYAHVGYGAAVGGTGPWSYSSPAGSGGGAADIRTAGDTLADRIVVAGGAGGAGTDNGTWRGSRGLGGLGGAVGGSGKAGGSAYGSAGGAGGGTAAGGTGVGSPGGPAPVSSGGWSSGGGGGGGYNGGSGAAGGAWAAGGGGGGSSYASPAVTVISSTAGGSPGAASLVLTY